MKVTFPEGQEMAKFAEGPPGLVVMSVSALELETKVALVALREQDAQLGDEIQPADLSGGAAVSWPQHPQARPLPQTNPHLLQVRFLGIGGFDLALFKDDNLHWNIPNQPFENVVVVVGTDSGHVGASPQPSDASPNQLYGRSVVS